MCILRSYSGEGGESLPSKLTQFSNFPFHKTAHQARVKCFWQVGRKRSIDGVASRHLKSLWIRSVHLHPFLPSNPQSRYNDWPIFVVRLMPCQPWEIDGRRHKCLKSFWQCHGKCGKQIRASSGLAGAQKAPPQLSVLRESRFIMPSSPPPSRFCFIYLLRGDFWGPTDKWAKRLFACRPAFHYSSLRQPDQSVRPAKCLRLRISRQSPKLLAFLGYQTKTWTYAKPAELYVFTDNARAMEIENFIELLTEKHPRSRFLLRK